MFHFNKLVILEQIMSKYFNFQDFFSVTSLKKCLHVHFPFFPNPRGVTQFPPFEIWSILLHSIVVGCISVVVWRFLLHPCSAACYCYILHEVEILEQSAQNNHNRRWWLGPNRVERTKQKKSSLNAHRKMLIYQRRWRHPD